jgi:ABC-type nitrate/sulfonate/bicarbonate transport system ATPase subunit
MSELVLKVEHLNKKFEVDKKEFSVLEDIDLEIEKGKFVTIVGHSGCGKSTLLKIIAGLVGYNEGSVTRNGHEVRGPGTDCGMVFQEHRLLPWLKIRDNIGFGLDSYPKAEKEKLIKKYLELVKLEDFENAYPKQLSGGMAQRAAIARGLVTSPGLLLLDEPFGALDALTRIQMQKEILQIWKKEKTTMIMVTHDIDEAIYLGDMIIVMSARPGRVKEILFVDAAAKKRGSTDFARFKKRIYSHFFEAEEENDVEYNI